MVVNFPNLECEFRCPPTAYTVRNTQHELNKIHMRKQAWQSNSYYKSIFFLLFIQVPGHKSFGTDIIKKGIFMIKILFIYSFQLWLINQVHQHLLM